MKTKQFLSMLYQLNIKEPTQLAFVLAGNSQLTCRLLILYNTICTQTAVVITTTIVFQQKKTHHCAQTKQFFFTNKTIQNKNPIKLIFKVVIK